MPPTAEHSTPPADSGLPQRLGRIVVLASAAVFVISGLAVLIALGGRIQPSSDPGSASTHVAWLWLGAALLLAICALTSRGVPWSTVAVGPRLRQDLILLIACAAAFPLAMRLPLGWHPADYLWMKVLVLLALPALVLWLTHRRQGPGVSFTPPRLPAFALVGALLAIAANQGLGLFGPGAAPADLASFDLGTIVLAATATALTASIGEEIFYRYWLQTRLEALLGRWAGILVASLIFGLMHLASHVAGHGLGLGAAIVIANQGVAGIVFGYLWSRYRRLWLPIALHLSTNGLQVVLYLLGVL